MNALPLNVAPGGFLKAKTKGGLLMLRHHWICRFKPAPMVIEVYFGRPGDFYRIGVSFEN